MATEIRINSEGKTILLPTFGTPGDSSSWDVLVRNIKALNNDLFGVFLTYMAIVVCHFGPESMDTFLLDLRRGNIPIVERLRDSAVIVKNQDRGVGKISLVRAILEFVGGPINLFQRNYDAALSLNENLAILDPWPKSSLRPAVTFGSLDEDRLVYMLKAIKPRGLPASPREIHDFIQARKQELVEHVPVGLPDRIANNVSRDLLYNVSYKTVDTYKLELAHKYRALAAAHQDNPMLVFFCSCTNSCLSRCKSGLEHTYDCDELTTWLGSVKGRNLYRHSTCAVTGDQPLERLDLIVSTMVWYHRTKAHNDAVAKGFREAAVGRVPSAQPYLNPTASLRKFDRLVSSHGIDDAHQVWEAMAIAFDSVYGRRFPRGTVQGVMAKYFFAGRREETREGMPECQAYWRLRETMDHKNAMRSMQSWGKH